MYIEVSYVIYLVVSVAMTIWVARTLSKNGLIFLIDSFAGNKDLAGSINHMLVVGFYLINFGYILLALQSGETINSLRAAIEFISNKIGLVLLVIGALHFSNIFVISKWRSRSIRQHTRSVNADA
jgi:hypothetical protein